MARQDLIPLRRGTKAAWTAANPTLAEGEPGFETDTYTLKVGDGSTPYTTLPAINSAAQYYNAQINGFNVSKDNDDVERKFFKDDFSVDSGDQYIEKQRVTFESGYALFTDSPASFVIDKTMTYDCVLTATVAFVNNLSTDSTSQTAYLKIIFDSTNQVNAKLYISNGGACHTKLDYCVGGVWSYNNISTFTHAGYDSYNRLGIVKVGNTYQLIIDGVLQGSPITIAIDGSYSVGMSYAWSGSSAQSKQLKIGELTISPSISYSDDFSADTVTGANGRYQAVTGTVAYDTNHMTLTTASGANGKGTARLKSYKFCEGSQVNDITLPTGADGDFICLVTHATNGTMSNGIGVGLQSDGAGNWNLATLSGTTVTEGTDSGLDDADVARIEIEKDISGAYWYYIYDAAGTKPTTPTGKLFTTLTEGYTGWYANGAGATTQVYSIDNISIRAESIVGRSNVPVEEDFWFRDEFGENSLVRYGSPTYFTIVDGYLRFSVAGTFTRNAIVPIGNVSIGTLQVDMQQVTIGGDGSYQTAYLGNYYLKLYPVWDFSSNGSLRLYRRSDNVELGIYSVDKTEQQSMQTYKLEVSASAVIVSYNGTPVITVSDGIVTTAGTVCLSGTKINSATACDFRFDNLQISGTRIYDKPIHRGAMLESYYDGSEEVAATMFVDDFNFDRLGEYTGVSASTVNVANALLTLADTTYIYPTAVSVGEGWYSLSLKRSAASGSVDVYVAGNTINFNNDGAIAFNGGAAESFAITAPSNSVTVGILVSGTSISIYEAGVLKGTKTGLTIVNSNFKLKRNTANWYIENLLICGESSQFENGVAASISGVGGGARYDTVETIGTTFDNEVQSGRYHAYARYLGTLADGTGAYLESRLENTTDSASIVIGESAVTFPLNIATTMGEYLDEDVWLNYDDVGDEITFNLERKAETTNNHQTVFVDSIALVPLSEVR